MTPTTTKNRTAPPAPPTTPAPPPPPPEKSAPLAPAFDVVAMVTFIDGSALHLRETEPAGIPGDQHRHLAIDKLRRRVEDWRKDAGLWHTEPNQPFPIYYPYHSVRKITFAKRNIRMTEIFYHDGASGCALNSRLLVAAVGDRGNGGAHHEYVITEAQSEIIRAHIKFQQGAVNDIGGVNGISNEALIAIVIDRLRGFQAGEFACRQNAIALTKLEEGLMWMHARSEDRQRRGVEGRQKP